MARVRRHVLPVLAAALSAGLLAPTLVAPVPPAAATTVDPLPDHAIGVKYGHTAPLQAEYEAWLGRPLDTGLFYFFGSSREEIYSGARALMRSFKGDKYPTLVFSLPFVFKGQPMEHVLAGANDDMFRELAAILVAGGRGDDVVRPGWEFNGDWFPWSGVGRWEMYAATFRRVVSVMRSVPGAENLRFEWNFGRGGLTVPDTAWPGSDYVDIIGMDIYDRSYAAREADPVARWEIFRTDSSGLDYLVSMGRRYNKPIAISEWGLSSKHVPGVNADNPYFIQQMHDWFHANNVAYMMYFERDNQYKHRLMRDHYPNSSALFRQLFGAGAPAPTTTTSTTAPSTTTTTRPATTTTTAPSTTTTTTAPSTTTTTAPSPDGGFVDAFGSEGLASGWTVTDGAGDGSVSVSGGSLHLSVPGGSTHDLWRTERRGLRVMRPIAASATTISATFDAAPDQAIGIQGIVVESGAGDLLRFDVQRLAGGTELFVGRVGAGGTSTTLRRVPVTASGPLTLTVVREANRWSVTVSSAAGSTSTSATTAFSAARAGVWLGNAGSGRPAQTVAVDEFAVR